MAIINKEELVTVGKILGTFGIKGYLKILSFTDPRSNILSYSPFYISCKEEWIEARISKGRLQGKSVVIKLDDFTSKSHALPLIGAELAIKSKQLKPVKKGEFYWSNLIGLTVINSQEQILGQVNYLIETEAHDVLVVKEDGQCRERLIPFVMGETIEIVDFDDRVIRVNWGTDY